MYLNSPLARILINAHSNGLHALAAALTRDACKNGLFCLNINNLHLAFVADGNK